MHFKNKYVPPSTVTHTSRHAVRPVLRLNRQSWSQPGARLENKAVKALNVLASGRLTKSDNAAAAALSLSEAAAFSVRIASASYFSAVDDDADAMHDDADAMQT